MATRSKNIERANYEVMRAQQIIMLAEVEADRYEKAKDTPNSPQKILEDVEDAMQMMNEGTPIANQSALLSAEAKEKNETSLKEMGELAEKIKSKVSKLIKQETEDETKTTFATLLAQASTVMDDYIKGKHSMECFGACTISYFRDNNKELQQKAAAGKISWEVASSNYRDLRDLHWQLSKDFYEIERIKACNPTLTVTNEWIAQTKSVLAEMAEIKINMEELISYRAHDKTAVNKPINLLADLTDKTLFLEDEAVGARAETSDGASQDPPAVALSKPDTVANNYPA